MTKPGYATTEFWLSLVAVVLMNVGALEVPDRFKWVATLAVIVGYALSRGLAKNGATESPVVVGPSPEDLAALEQTTDHKPAKSHPRVKSPGTGTV